MARPSLRLLTAAITLACLAPPGGPAGAQSTDDPAASGPAEVVHYRPPVAAPVADRFRPPATPYGAGNLGLEYATSGGEEVRAAAAGTVTFAGPVGAELFVTVQHADRLRTTYGRLAGVAVIAGAEVGAGEPLGTAGAAFIWTARIGEAYVDPEVLLAASATTRVWLVAEP